MIKSLTVQPHIQFTSPIGFNPLGKIKQSNLTKYEANIDVILNKTLGKII